MDNIDMDQIRQLVRSRVPEERFNHIQNVEKTAVALAKRFDVDEKKAALAALLHDAMRGQTDQAMLALAQTYGVDVDAYTKQVPKLLHGPLAACWAKRTLGIADEEVLDAVRAHTVGDDTMAPLTCILYLADAIEPARDFPGVENLRKAAEDSLHRAALLAVKHSEQNIIQKGQKPHPISAYAIDALERIIKEAEKR